MICDGSDLKYLLEKKGFSLSDVAKQLEVTPQTIFHVVMGLKSSQRVVRHIEKLLGLAPGTLEITREKRDAIVKFALNEA